ncbi:hypothetical protein GCM10027280_23200 [Micromonospora polyrhachis]
MVTLEHDEITAGYGTGAAGTEHDAGGGDRCGRAGCDSGEDQAGQDGGGTPPPSYEGPAVDRSGRWVAGLRAAVVRHGITPQWAVPVVGPDTSRVGVLRAAGAGAGGADGVR